MASLKADEATKQSYEQYLRELKGMSRKKGIFSFLKNDPSDHYYYAKPVDPRGSTTYPPDDSGPSDLVIDSCLCVALVAAVYLVSKLFKKLRS